MDDDPIQNNPFQNYFHGGVPSPTPTPSPTPQPVDYRYLLDPSLLAAMKSRFVQQVDVNPPYSDSIPKEYRQAESQGPLVSDSQPFTDKEREAQMPPEFRFENHNDATHFHIHVPVMRYEGSRIPIEGSLTRPEMI